MSPHVSVIIPVYNRPELLVRALRSVSSQTLRDLEILVVDDGSTVDVDRSLSEINDPRIRLLRHQNRRGASAARNTGIQAARGRYLSFLDSDDYWRDRKLARQLAFMGAAPQARPLSCTAFSVTTAHNTLGERRCPADPCTHRSLQLGCGLSPGTTLLSTREFIDEIGPFNEAMQRLEDWEFLLRCTVRVPIPVLSEDLAVIDVQHRDPGQYERTRDAARILQESQFPLASSWTGRRRFRSYVEREVAASAYNDGRQRLAVVHFARSLLIFPWVRFSQLSRLLRRVLSDALKI